LAITVKQTDIQSSARCSPRSRYTQNGGDWECKTGKWSTKMLLQCSWYV